MLQCYGNISKLCISAQSFIIILNMAHNYIVFAIVDRIYGPVLPLPLPKTDVGYSCVTWTVGLKCVCCFARQKYSILVT